MVNIFRLLRLLRFGWVVAGSFNLCQLVLGCFGCIFGLTELFVVVFT